MIGGTYRVTDAHCHIYPDKIAEAATANTDRFYNVTSTFDGRVSTLLKQKETTGVDHFVVQSVATTPKQVAHINEFIARTAAESGGIMTGLGTLHPDSPDLASDVRQIKELGLHGVKLHPDIQQFKIDDYRCLKIYELCEREQLPVLMHTGDRRYDLSNPNRLLPVVQIFDRLTVIAAHLGGYSMWEEAGEKLAGVPNLYFDCSSTFHWVDNDTVRKIIRNYGADRVMFGTDYPMWRADRELERFLSLGLSEKENRQILSENAEKVYGILR